MTRLTTETDLDDFLRGANFLSASGGGDPAEQRRLLRDDLDRGLDVGWADLVAEPTSLTAAVICSGSIAPSSFDEPPEATRLASGTRLARPMTDAVRELERYLGREVDQLVSAEIGGINTGAILDAAANLDKPLVDGDYAGRAIPELDAITPTIAGLDLFPWALVDEYGNRLVLREAASSSFGERISKFLAKAAFGWTAVAYVPVSGADAARALVAGTLSECLAVGRAIRDAQQAGTDPVSAAAGALGGWVLFRGTLAKREWADTGYMEGTHDIDGEGAHAGHALRIWFKNENHVSWLDGEPYVCSPDLMEVCDADTGEPLVNTDLAEGRRVAVVARCRRELFDSERGLAILGPAHFGWDVPFTPVEQLVG